jgi:hypothetical protein
MCSASQHTVPHLRVPDHFTENPFHLAERVFAKNPDFSRDSRCRRFLLFRLDSLQATP